jgi:hypothetical protein
MTEPAHMTEPVPRAPRLNETVARPGTGRRPAGGKVLHSSRRQELSSGALLEVPVIFRLYHETRGAHEHCRLFSGPHEGALAKCGDLVMRSEEFAQFRASATFIQFRPERGQIGGDND